MRLKFNPSNNRLRFILTVGFTWLLMGVLFLNLGIPPIVILILAFLAGSILTYFSIREGASHRDIWILLLLPVLLQLGTSLFIYSLPNKSPLAIVVWLMYLPLGYATILGANIFNVARAKTIPLLRVAQTTYFIITLATIFIFISMIHLHALNWLLLLIISGVICYFLVWQYLWTFNQEHPRSPIFMKEAGLATTLFVEVALVLTFFPLKYSTRGLLLTTFLYCILGLSRARREGDMTSRIIAEYAMVVGIVILLMIISL
ncbi:hypothetical protein A3A70_00500 [candidate division WWE3 bacterium RIFCSPLOWO2_01_FULL_42_11]|uniref:Uncharacterized protein n=1 Tax=candidate division WWE3 bacterium RIFCSPLOWO2_01_FULL_42_11 TaxID=1802627 RepID=A0A1F4VP92_UNCKA|nr:MAG: hypothetical protein A3A70_00500 [candidate division WWE3 bacterium RIFCSPLOWO2_01_FULL_42_11]